MPDDRRKNCVACGRHSDDVGPISWSGKCGTCGPALAIAAADSLHYHTGPHFLTWRRRVAASVGGILLDDLDALARQD